MGARSDDDPTTRAVRVRELPSALPVRDRFGSRIRGELAVFLDYDGTLAPIVDDPDAVRIERKGFAIAVHDRQVDDPELRTRIADVVTGLGEEHARLRATGRSIADAALDTPQDTRRFLAELHDLAADAAAR